MFWLEGVTWWDSWRRFECGDCTSERNTLRSAFSSLPTGLDGVGEEFASAQQPDILWRWSTSWSNVTGMCLLCAFNTLPIMHMNHSYSANQTMRPVIWNAPIPNLSTIWLKQSFPYSQSYREHLSSCVCLQEVHFNSDSQILLLVSPDVLHFRRFKVYIH